MKKLIGCFVLAVFCTGCTAHMMETHGDTIQLFKTGQEKPGHGGVIRYLNTGLESLGKTRDVLTPRSKWSTSVVGPTKSRPKGREASSAPRCQSATALLLKWINTHMSLSNAKENKRSGYRPRASRNCRGVRFVRRPLPILQTDVRSA